MKGPWGCRVAGTRGMGPIFAGSPGLAQTAAVTSCLGAVAGIGEVLRTGHRAAQRHTVQGCSDLTVLGR